MNKTMFSTGGHAYITSQINEAIRNESRTARISGYWEIDEAVRLPSNFTLIIQDCHLRMADGCFSNMFINENHETEKGKTQAGTDRNISIIGCGEAILDGGKFNGLSEKTKTLPGMPPTWKNALIFLANVEGFKVSGISCRNQRWWAMNFIYCSHGYIGNIDFCANDTAIDPNGNEYHGLRRKDYYDTLVKNADGIDLRMGCHDIVIENITGFTEDDSVALTACAGVMEREFQVEGLPSDICHVEIRDIRTASFCNNIRLFCPGGVKLHHITVDGVYDMGPQCPYMDNGVSTVRVGDYAYGPLHLTKEDFHHIMIRNIRGGEEHVIVLMGPMSDVVMYGIEAFNGARMLLDLREQ